MAENENDFICLSKTLIQQYGLKVAAFLAELINLDTKKDYFECSSVKIETDIGLKKRQQEYIANKLIDLNFIYSKLQGYPAKRYIKINYENLPDCIKARSPTPQQEKTPLTNVQSDKSTSKPNLTSQAKEIIEYFNAKANTKYKADNKKTLDLIKARLKEGFTIDDFKNVIDKKTIEWVNDPSMYKYLRPVTLFSTKFESYLNQPTRKPSNKSTSKFQNFKPREYDFEEIERLAQQD